MTVTYKILSAALSYPTAELQEAADELRYALNAECALPAQLRAGVGDLLDDIRDGDLLDLQADYVDLFDRTRALSLHLFEHVHGESRDRGQAMVSLRERYRQGGLDISAGELPDYVPLFLEFLSTLPASDARAMLADAIHIVALLEERLRARGSRYAVLFSALQSLCEAAVQSDILDELRKAETDDPFDLEALDRAWEEAEVRFGPDTSTAGSCPRADDMLRKMTRPTEPRASGRPLDVEP